MKIYALWNIERKAFYSTGHGCGSGAQIISFKTKIEAQNFAEKIGGEYKIKGISVGG